MSLNTILKPASLAGRLTVWYTGVSTLLFLSAIGTIYFLTSTVLLNQVDEDLDDDLQEFNAIYREEGIVPLWQELQKEVAEDGSAQVLFRLYTSDGDMLRSTDDGTWSDHLPPDNLGTTLQENPEPIVSTVHLESHEFPARTIYGVISDANGNYILQVTESLEERADVLEIFQLTFLICLPFLVALSLLAGWIMARKSLSGVELVTNTAIDISNGALDERVSLNDQGAEIDRLAATFNSMLDKIQLLIRGMREINDNIAHDLKSPLARIRGLAESTLTDKHDESQYQHLAGSTIEECDRLLHLINTMLDLAETEAGLVHDTETVNLTELIYDASEIYQALASENNIELTSDIGQEILIKGNKQFLQRLIGNLLDNAIKYTPEGGKVAINDEIAGNDVLIKISDTGMGISSDDLPNIFQRFYRCDMSRNKPGTGLGLSLALAIAKAHLGNISVNSRIAQGSQFIVTLPLAN
ncbi:MAG: HAMP domain-containing sensor histidine kinase [Proteobacteria bacterium]|nr:HAMP domain-containing sensor histidine kinase [Pseudomonadota bacterium]